MINSMTRGRKHVIIKLLKNGYWGEWQMKRVLVKSLNEAFDFVLDHYYPAGCEEDAKRKDTYAVISIQDTHTGGFGVTFSENKFCKGVLTLYFDDVVKETKGAVLFDEKMADSVITVIRNHMDVDILLIHCYAGQSRSRAVGAFAEKMLGRNNKKYFSQKELWAGTPNEHVYHMLEDAWFRDMLG